MDKKVYIIGHRNPDTDSVVSAAAYARLKRAQGQSHYHAARAGNLSPQTEYIFERFKVPVPEYIPDLIPKAEHYLSEPAATVSAGLSLWDALERMQQENVRAMPITDSNGVYKSMLHYRGFARYIITHINPNQKSHFLVSIDHLIKTLRAKPINIVNNTEVKKSSFVVAAAYNKYFISRLENEDPENALVIMGDRIDLQRHCIERGVRALILSNNHTLDEELTALAKKNNVSVMSSPYDTASTAMLIMYSAPVGTMGDESVPLMRLSDPVRKLKEPLSHAPSRGLPIGDDEGHVKGMLFEGDLIKEPNIELILVDHNELSQAIEGAENYRILEVIDHHRLGSFSTRYPITFINKVVGATCTIITGLYREQQIPLEKDTAAILLCGIIADTLGLQSATTTETDHEAAAYLSSFTGLDIQELTADIQTAANRITAKPAAELINMDMKEYTEQNEKFTVSQVETDNPDNLVIRKAEIFTALEKIAAERGLLFSSLLVTDIKLLDSILFVSGKKSFVAGMQLPKLDDGIYILNGVVSRKKQLMPLLSELIEKGI
jgi:manganese-dependent inorganic pyrophosphatase